MINLSHYDWLATLTPVRSYLEIGVQEGRSLEAVVRANPGLEKIVLCDTWGAVDGGTNRGSHNHIEILLYKLGYTNAITYLNGESQKLLPQVREALGKHTFDLIHVDGDHSYEGAKADLKNITRLAKRWVVVHDIFFPDVWKATSEWLQVNQHDIVLAEINAEGTGSVTAEFDR